MQIDAAQLAPISSRAVGCDNQDILALLFLRCRFLATFGPARLHHLAEFSPTRCGDSAGNLLLRSGFSCDCVRMRSIQGCNGVLNARTLFFELLQYLCSIHGSSQEKNKQRQLLYSTGAANANLRGQCNASGTDVAQRWHNCLPESSVIRWTSTDRL